jgi:hypothetical protein
LGYFMELISPSQAALDLAAAKAARARLSTAADDKAVAAEHRYPALPMADAAHRAAIQQMTL